MGAVAWDPTAGEYEKVEEQAVVVEATDSLTLGLADGGNVLRVTKASGANVTVPPNVDVPFAEGDTITLVQGGAGKITVVPGAGVTVRVRSFYTLLTAGTYAVARLTKLDTNEWVLTGDLTAD